jgi:hypothetical protein
MEILFKAQHKGVKFGSFCNVKITVFWDVHCTLLVRYQHCGEAYCLHLGKRSSSSNESSRSPKYQYPSIKPHGITVTLLPRKMYIFLCPVKDYLRPGPQVHRTSCASLATSTLGRPVGMLRLG